MPSEPSDDATTYPMPAASADRAAIPTHISMIDECFVPAALSETVAAIASGRLEMNTAARNATLTAPPTVRPMPSTSDSGIPSRIVPRTIAPPEPADGASSSGLRSLRLPPPIRDTTSLPR